MWLLTRLCSAFNQSAKAAAAAPSSTVELVRSQQSGVGPVRLRARQFWSRCSSSTGDVAAWAARWNFWTSFLEPLSDSSSCGGYASVSEALDAFTVLTGRASGCIFFISFLTALDEFYFSMWFWQIRILKSAALSLWPCSSSYGSGVHSAGFAGLNAPRAMFLTFAGRSAALVNFGSGMLLLVLLVFSHFALRSRRLPACVVCLFISSSTSGFNWTRQRSLLLFSPDDDDEGFGEDDDYWTQSCEEQLVLGWIRFLRIFVPGRVFVGVPRWILMVPCSYLTLTMFGRERDKALLRSTFVGGVWNGFLLGQVRGQDVPCRFCGGRDHDGHLFWDCTVPPPVEIREHPEFHDLMENGSRHLQDPGLPSLPSEVAGEAFQGFFLALFPGGKKVRTQGRN